ncbi:MAG: hypothetical protein ABW051_08655 [Burkholderiaceae bacterium]
MCLRNAGFSSPRPTEPDVAQPHQKSPSKQPPIPMKEPVEPDRRAWHPAALLKPWMSLA